MSTNKSISYLLCNNGIIVNLYKLHFLSSHFSFNQIKEFSTFLLFQIHFPTDSLSHSLSHLNIISSFIAYSFINHHFILFLTTIFFNEKCYVHNILRNTFTTKFMWKVVTSSNLNPPLKLFFYSPILTNNNLLLKIYCKNIVVVFFN